MVHSTEQGLKLQFLVAALIAALVFLHYLLWLDENGVRQTHTLRIGVRAQTEENAELAERNRALAAEVEGSEARIDGHRGTGALRHGHGPSG